MSTLAVRGLLFASILFFIEPSANALMSCSYYIQNGTCPAPQNSTNSQLCANACGVGVPQNSGPSPTPTLPPLPKGYISCGTLDLNRVTANTGFAYFETYFAAGGDSSQTGSSSPIVLFENNALLSSSHALHADVRGLGAGRFSHWGNSLYFSATDNSDPRTNGKIYGWGVAAGKSCPVQLCGAVNTTNANPEIGKNYILPENFGFPGDSMTAGTQSSLQLFENNVAMGPAHSLHADIRTFGGGRFSHWGNNLYFSSTDGSDPRTNGKTYLYGGNCRKLQTLNMSQLSSAAPFYATFNSHNNKIVDHSRGIFVSYHSHLYPGPQLTASGGNGFDSTSDWNILQSVDQGASFQKIYSENVDTIDPAPIEVDTRGNLYAFRQTFKGLANNQKALNFYRFLSTKNYVSPLKVTLSGYGSDKASATYDAARNRFYYSIANYTAPSPMLTLNTNGQILASQSLTAPTPIAFLMYPLFAMDGASLFTSWTSQWQYQQPDGTLIPYLYYDIQFMKSLDGGSTFSNSTGSTLSLPVLADSNSTADLVSLPDEFKSHVWLANMLAVNGYVYFFYYSPGEIDPVTNQMIVPSRQHLLRYNVAAKTFDLKVYPTVSGNQFQIVSQSGFLAVDRTGSTGKNLYVVGNDPSSNRIVVLASDDDGATWFDYAVSPSSYVGIYSISGAQSIGNSGQILGMFTSIKSNSKRDNLSDVWFFRVPAGK